MSTDGQGTKRRRKIAEIYNRLSRVHERYGQTDDRQTDGRQQIANVYTSSRSLKMTRCFQVIPRTNVSRPTFCALYIKVGLLLLGRIVTTYKLCYSVGNNIGLLLPTEQRGLSVCLSVCHTSVLCKNSWSDRDAVWVEDSGGPKEPRIR